MQARLDNNSNAKIFWSQKLLPALLLEGQDLRPMPPNPVTKRLQYGPSRIPHLAAQWENSALQGYQIRYPSLLSPYYIWLLHPTNLINSHLITLAESTNGGEKPNQHEPVTSTMLNNNVTKVDKATVGSLDSIITGWLVLGSYTSAVLPQGMSLNIR